MNRHLDTLARTLYGEAEGGNVNDAEAIASVIMNRVAYEKWPDDVASVCLQPLQFSCWNANDPNRKRILAVKGGQWFTICTEIAERAINGSLSDPTHGGTHYYETGIKKPKWAKGHKPVHSVPHRGGTAHVFYNDIDTKPPADMREALEQARPLGSTGTIKAARTGAVGTVGVAAATEIVRQIEPALPLTQVLAEYAPWALVVLLLAVIGYMVWRRVDDRNAGLR